MSRRKEPAIPAELLAILAVPILIQVYFNAGLAYWLSRHFGVAWCVAAPAALIGASNFFELAVAAAISLFGVIPYVDFLAHCYVPDRRPFVAKSVADKSLYL